MRNGGNSNLQTPDKKRPLGVAGEEWRSNRKSGIDIIATVVRPTPLVTARVSSNTNLVVLAPQTASFRPESPTKMEKKSSGTGLEVPATSEAAGKVGEMTFFTLGGGDDQSDSCASPLKMVKVECNEVTEEKAKNELDLYVKSPESFI